MTCITSNALAFSKPCEYVASVGWGWEGETITHLLLSTDAYALRHDRRNQNRPDAGMTHTR